MENIRLSTRWMRVFGIVLPALTFLMAAAAIADPKLTPVPEGVSVAGTRGFDQVRTVVLKPSATIQSWKLTPVDLSRKDGLTIFPAALIHPELSTGTQVTTSDLVSVPIRFAISHAPSSGQFNGVLLVRYDGGDVTIPVTLSIKDPPWLPLLLVVLGVLTGISLSTYQAEGFDRDEVVLQIERLRVQMQSSTAFRSAFPDESNPFLTRINGILAKVDTALADKKWETARTLTQSARAVWDQWRGNESEWLRLLRYKQMELDSRLDADLSVGTPYGKAVQHHLENAVLQMPEYEGPRQFGEKLQEIRQQIDHYLQGQQQLDRLTALSNRLGEMQVGVSETRQEFWRDHAKRLQNRLDYLSPTNQEGFGVWQQAVEAAVTEIMAAMEKVIPLEETEGSSEIGIRGNDVVKVGMTPVLELPFIRDRVQSERPEQAEKRFRWKRQGLKWIAVISLAGIGFNQLYIANPTFGATQFGDYFTLLAWGFGAEVSRESVTKVLQRFRLPGVQ